MKNGAINYTIRFFIQRVLGMLMYLLGAWWTMNLRSWVYFSIYFVTAIISCVVMFHINQETLSERGKINTDSPVWDKWLTGLFWLLAFFIIYLVAGLEAAKAPPPDAVFWTGIILQIPAAALSLHALTVNTFLESTARIQTERKQTVCKSGPYHFVRHPTYSSILIWCISVSMIFGTLFVIVISAVIMIIIIIRTYLEDKMLKQLLAGYEEYAGEVKYRLVPFIW